MRYTVYLILLSSLCVDGIAEDQKIEYQNFAPEDLVYTFVFQSTGSKYDGSNGTIKFARKPKDEVVCDLNVRLPAEKDKNAIDQTFHFSYTRAGATLKCDILSAIKSKSVDGHFLAILSQTIPIAIPIGLCRVAPSRYQPLTCRRQDFPEGDQIPSGDFMFNIGVNLGSANPISKPFSYLWQKDERGYADIRYGAGASVTEVISAELQYDEKNVYFKGKISWAQRMTQKRDVTLPVPVESGWSFSYETKTAK